jgi:Flp pilus assembly pilin Flp
MSMLVVKTLFAILKAKSGSIAIEYCLMITLIAVACITAFEFVGTNVSANFNTIAMNL